jgi:Phage integrase family
LQRAVLASGGTGELFVDTLKSKRARTVPLVAGLVPIVDRWAQGKTAGAWLFDAPRGGMLSEGNWKRSVGWSAAVKAIGFPRLRVHDLRHTAASVWLGVGADPKVVQRILGHASAAMTMDLYGYLVDQNLWDAAQRFAGDTSRARPRNYKSPGLGKWSLTWGFGWSRLSESNRRPSHYGEERHRRMGSLPPVSVTRPPAVCARFPMSIRRFMPRVMPRQTAYRCRPPPRA